MLEEEFYFTQWGVAMEFCMLFHKIRKFIEHCLNFFKNVYTKTVIQESSNTYNEALRITNSQKKFHTFIM